VDPVEVKKISNLTAHTSIKKYYLSQDPQAQTYHGVRCLFWQDGIKEIFKIDQT